MTYDRARVVVLDRRCRGAGADRAAGARGNMSWQPLGQVNAAGRPYAVPVKAESPSRLGQCCCPR
jgi:hypothetical protein